ncbi:MAG: hypothetical protein ABI895_08885 [Deltaproteobacteria bacterium]
MGEEQHQRGRTAGAGEGGCRSPAESNVAPQAATRQHLQVPTECALCGAAEFSSVIEVGVGSSRMLHWVSPPAGWYLLREARPERGAPLLHGRCPECMAGLLGTRPAER